MFSFKAVTPAKAGASLVKLRSLWKAIPAYAGMTMFAATPASASTGEAVNPWVALAYLVSGVFFILALRGLSSPATSRTGNRFGMAGMLIAVVTTLITHWPQVISTPCKDAAARGEFGFCTEPLPYTDWALAGEILIAIAIGAIIGITIARRIAMTAMPELVAAFHSLVGLAAVLVGWAAYLNPEGFGLLMPDGGIGAVSKIEMGLGIAIGAIPSPARSSPLPSCRAG